ncbi:MAG: RluA family pseudouridine synthase [Verrucomicrobia bacterium]|nr:RluA family pseudouridine synthase [Verrucomicrobiota bacterium]MCH8512930.1 RluA family pseudouridine synthase [Kiritimatiellia bacterium]
MPPIPILHADDDLLVVIKPHRLLTIPGRTPDKADSLWTRLQSEHPQKDVRLVHRLDRDTAGLMVFALHPAAQANLGRQFEQRRVQKIYHAVLAGELSTDEGRIDAPLRKDWTRNDPPVYIIDPEKGKSAITRYQVAWRKNGLTGVHLYPETGRSHQLRVHMESLGHPIFGDPIYGQAHPDHPLQLCAVTLGLHQPTTGEPLQFHLPPAHQTLIGS